ncbi:MAG: 30S ribosomal protein S4 [Patescibacteria group bacterium]|nr:30S ribosomal protein S4 [Patescibacteria group bacterium]MDE2172961.1 30S ribosomal protein S4 [Patescibacteria group bacterium]
MIIGPRYKKARYLGAPVFRKTQTQKYALRVQRKVKIGKHRSNKSEYGRQMLEKQKARFSYGVSGRQFTNYVNAALAASGDNAKNLLRLLESRLDNVMVRAGFAPTRSAARQMVSHGHIRVNGTVVTIPSFAVTAGDIISIREGSKTKAIFGKLDDDLRAAKFPNWLTVDAGSHEIKITGEPALDMTELLFDIRQVLEFYTR